MKNTLTIILLFLVTFLYSQKEFEAKGIIINTSAEAKLIIEKYPNIKLYKNTKCNFNKNTPEQKFCRFFNIRKKEELVNFFKPNKIPTSYNKDDYLTKMKVYNENNNYYILDSKYVFDYGLSKDIFIKYININENFPKPIYSVFYLQNFSDKLVVKDMGENFDIGLFLINSNTIKTMGYLHQKSERVDVNLLSDKLFANVRDKSKKNDEYYLIDKEYSPFYKEQNKSVITDKISKVQEYDLSKAFHDIIDGKLFKDYKVLKDVISKNYNIPINYLSSDSLSVREVINVKCMNNNYKIIKFYNSKSIVKTESKILKNDLVHSFDLLKVLMKMNFEVFIAFYSNKKSKKYPEINKLKPKVKDSNGNLDIEKLVKVITENKGLLNKYLDY